MPLERPPKPKNKLETKKQTAIERLLTKNPKLVHKLLSRGLAEKSLAEFIKQYWHVVEPSTPLVWGWVMDAICEHLEAVTRGEIKKIIINVPPGFSKSLTTNVFWPAWEWAIGKRSLRYLCVSYSQRLTIRDNRRFLRLVSSKEYQSNWPIKLDQESVVNVGNTDTGWKLAASIGSGVTGERGDRIICLPYNGIILSDHGWLKIGDVVSKKLPVKIAGHDKSNIVWQDIDTYETNEFRPLVQIDYGSGVLRCTEDHRVFTQRGYISAIEVRKGDKLCGCRVQSLPWRPSWSSETKIGVEEKIVRSVRRISDKEQFTYNIKVAPCHNYFADGVLVHNCDDANNVAESESEAVLESTNLWLKEVMPDRLNNMSDGAIINIQQRTSELDATGTLLDLDIGYEHLMIPMEYDSTRHCTTSIGWNDPRTQEGELAFLERFPEKVVSAMKVSKGPWAYNSQYQQLPAPRGGGIIKREWWKLWPPEDWPEEDKNKIIQYPPMDFILASADTAYTEKQENDPSALAVLGVFRMKGIPKVMLMSAWAKHLEFNDLLNEIIKICRKRKVDALLVEGKASGKSIIQEIRRTVGAEEFALYEAKPDTDKVSRTHAVVPVFSSGCVYAPDREWADIAINQVSVFPKGKNDDIHDAIMQGVAYLRKSGMLALPDEAQHTLDSSFLYENNFMDTDPLYDV